MLHKRTYFVRNDKKNIYKRGEGIISHSDHVWKWRTRCRCLWAKSSPPIYHNAESPRRLSGNKFFLGRRRRFRFPRHLGEKQRIRWKRHSQNLGEPVLHVCIRETWQLESAPSINVIALPVQTLGLLETKSLLSSAKVSSLGDLIS